MRDTAFVFFVAAAVSVVSGMLWGIQMSISHDHLLAPAHAHLNLVGWVTLALYGVYYRLTPLANNTRLAQAHAGIAIVGVVVMVTGIAIVRGGGPATLAAIGAMLSLLSAGIFLATVMRNGFGARS
jgi:cbb3-type cytochrome oxidase subunit 1